MYRLLDLLYTLLIGLIAGWLGSLLMRGGRKSVLIYMIIGVIGAFIGSFLFGLVGLAAYGLLGRIIMATLGAVILIFLLRRLRGI
ncbi:GlsB/YeaQ/YmgE family stress response membrane protein [bacterium]|nr:GlsB/YeaQ/YmgE family stress response membrane protein [bacterium]MCI0605954.1 GlsB/YeaQ/YmgE family stress response membrane protein [bacterium]